MTVLATPALYSSRPAFDLDGSEATELSDRLLSMVVTETTEGLSHCEAVFGNWGRHGGSHTFVFNDRQTVDFGTEIRVGLGAGDRAGSVFTGIVTGIEANYPSARSPEITFLAEDKLQDLRMTRRTRTFDDATDADVIRQVASGHGLTVHLDIDGPTHRLVTQLNQSDLAFVRDRARLVDADVWIEGDELNVVQRQRRNSGELTLTYNVDLHEASILADLAGQRTRYVVGGWDVAAKEAIAAEAGASAIQPELDGDTSGIELVEQVFGPRPETLAHTAPATQAEARARAEMALRTSARRFVTAHAIAEGDARLRVGAHVELDGLGSGFSGTYYLVEVEHSFDTTNGYRTRFRAERPGLGGTP